MRILRYYTSTVVYSGIQYKTLEDSFRLKQYLSHVQEVYKRAEQHHQYCKYLDHVLDFEDYVINCMPYTCQNSLMFVILSLELVSI